MLGVIALCCRSAESIDRSTDAHTDGAHADVSGDGRDGERPTTSTCAKDGECVDAAETCPGVDLAPSTEIANRLARFLWNVPSAPDDLLLRVAMNTPEDVSEVAALMLIDRRAQAGVSAFVRSWLRLDDLASLQKPGAIMTSDLIASMQNEAPAVAVAVILEGDAKYNTLLRAPFTYVNEVLARHYGIGGVVGSEMRKVEFGTPERIGILTGAGVLARFSGTLNPPWPPRRYWLVYETLLCDSAALPPAIPQSARFDSAVTIREDLEMNTSRAPCNACHVTVNPIGFTFSRFDTFGRYASLDERGAPLNTTETVPSGLTLRTGLSAVDAADLIAQLTSRSEVRRCFAARLLDYALHPGPRASSSLVDVLPPVLQCDLTRAHAAFEASGGDIKQLILAIVQTGAFLQAN